MNKVLSPRWENITAQQRTMFATRRAIEKNKKMSAEERKAHARKMVAARGSWVTIDGKKVYVRAADEKAFYAERARKNKHVK